jgi:hypothetical protein
MRARPRRSFAASGGASREPKRLANQLSAIRAKIRFWRAPMRREVFARENFFIAKICDSESMQRAFGHTR